MIKSRSRLLRSPDEMIVYLSRSYRLHVLASRMTSNGQQVYRSCYKVNASCGFRENRLFLEKENHSGLPDVIVGRALTICFFFSSSLVISCIRSRDGSGGILSSRRMSGYRTSRISSEWPTRTASCCGRRSGCWDQSRAVPDRCSGTRRANKRKFQWTMRFPYFWGCRMKSRNRGKVFAVGVCIRIRLLIVSSTRHDEEAVADYGHAYSRL